MRVTDTAPVSLLQGERKLHPVVGRVLQLEINIIILVGFTVRPPPEKLAS